MRNKKIRTSRRYKNISSVSSNGGDTIYDNAESVHGIRRLRRSSFSYSKFRYENAKNIKISFSKLKREGYKIATFKKYDKPRKIRGVKCREVVKCNKEAPFDMLRKFKGGI